MQRFIKACRQKQKQKGGSSSREEYDNDECNQNLNKSQTTKTNTDKLSPEILDRLGKIDSDHAGSFSEEREITHIRQTETWDCGVACVQMILQWLRQNSVDDLQHNISVIGEEINSAPNQMLIEEKAWILECVATESIWTIDLVMLLEHILSAGTQQISSNKNDNDTVQENTSEGECSLGRQQYSFILPSLSSFSYLFCSTKLGVDESYNNLEYYKDAFSKDEKRVNNLLDIAQKQKLPLLETSNISFEVLVDVISKEGVVAIVLVDNRILKYSTIHTSSYSGHYVVLCGISRDENDINYAQMQSPEENDNARRDFCMILKNPGSWKEVEFVTPSIFEKAWRAKGTDEDVIFLAKHEL